LSATNGTAVPGALAAPVHAYPAARAAWGFVVILALASVVSYLDRQVLNLLVDPIRRDLAISDTQVSLLQGIAFSLFYALAGLWIGGLIDRYNRRTIVAAGIAVWSLMTAYCGLADSFGELVVGRIGVAIGEACLIPASYSLLSDLFEPARRGRAAGVLSTGMALGNGLSLVVSGLLLAALDGGWLAGLPQHLPRSDWQLVFLIVGLAGLPVVLLLFLVREPRRLGVRDDAAAVPLAAVVRFLGEHWVAIVCLFGATTLMMVASSGLLAWGPTILIRELGQTRADAGFQMGVALLTGGAIGPLVMGWLSDRNVAAGCTAPRLRLFSIGGPTMAVGVLLAALARDASAALAGMFVVMLCAVGFATMLYTAIQDICPNQLRGRVVAVATICTNVFGLGVGPTLVAYAKDSLLPAGTSLATSYGIVGLPIVALATALAIAGHRPFARAEVRLAG
jgi:MFS family permease